MNILTVINVIYSLYRDQHLLAEERDSTYILQNSKNVHVRYSSLQFAFEMTTKGSKTPTNFIAFQIMIMDIRSP